MIGGAGETSVMKKTLEPHTKGSQGVRIPCYSDREDLIYTKRANRYITRQNNRFMKLVKDQNIKAAFRVYKFLVTKSISFRVAYFNKVCKGWYYNYGELKTKVLMKQLNKLINTWDGNLNSRREYVLKADGKRYRPLGIPSLNFRIITSMWANFLQKVLMPNISESQHGFLPGRSISTAIKEVYKNSKKWEVMYEFDLDSCFNRIELEAVEVVLRERGIPLELINYIQWINKTPPKITRNEIMEEYDKELYPITQQFSNGWNAGIIRKRGMPQGLPWSPIIAITVIDHFLGRNKEDVKVTLFADDGIMFSDSSEKIMKVIKWFKLDLAGIIFSKKNKPDGNPSCRFIDEEEIKFLNTVINTRTGIVRSEKGYCHVDDNLDKMNKILWNGYFPEAKKDWTWKVDSNSFMVKHLLTYDLLEWIRSWLGYMRDWMDYLLGKKQQRSWRLHGLFMPYEYGKMSSHCCEMLLRVLKSKSKGRTLLPRVSRDFSIENLYSYEEVQHNAGILEFFRRVPTNWLYSPDEIDRHREMTGTYRVKTRIIGNESVRTLQWGISQQTIRMGINREKMIRKYWKLTDL